MNSRIDPVVLIREHRARLVALAMLVGYFIALFAVGGYWQWGRFGVPTQKHGPFETFVDTRVITSGWECVRRGVDVYRANPCNPLVGNIVNYPHIWMFPSFLGLGQSSTNEIAITLIAVFLLVALFVIPRGAPRWMGALFGAALCSPAVMFGVHHGNIDLAVFVVVALALLLTRSQLGGLVASCALLFLAGVLKLFPIAALGAIVVRRPGRTTLQAAAMVFVAWAIYALATLGQIRLALRSTPQPDYVGFGVRRFSEWVVSGANGISPWFAAGVTQKLSMRAWDIAVIVAAVGIVLLTRRWWRGIALDERTDPRELALFWAGASIYVFAYAVMRNWDYRMVFTLLTIPQLARWASSRRSIAIVTLLALFAAIWLDTSWSNLPAVARILDDWNAATIFGPFQGTLPLAVLAQLVLFIGLLASLTATIPAGLVEHARLWRASSVRVRLVSPTNSPGTGARSLDR